MEMFNDYKKIRSKVAAMESKIDLLESEIAHLDEMLRECGFPQGITTLKRTVEEIILEMNEEDPFFDEDE